MHAGCWEMHVHFRLERSEVQIVIGSRRKRRGRLGLLKRSWMVNLRMAFMAKLFQLFGITYVVGKIKFKLLFQGSIR